MELKILKEKENPLFNRKEVIFELKVEKTPTREETEQLIHEKFSVPVENIKIKKISGKFGLRVFKISANIYSSKEEKERIEGVKQKTKEKNKQ